MKRTSLVIALALAVAVPTAASADSRIVRFCGPAHVNEIASEGDVRPNPDGYYVASLMEQISQGDPMFLFHSWIAVILWILALTALFLPMYLRWRGSRALSQFGGDED